MAPIYLAKKTATTTKGPNIFVSKGITGYAPSTISSLAIIGLPHERQVAYGAYVQNIDAFIYATAKKDRVFTGRDGFPGFTMPKVFDRVLPTVIFAPAFNVNPDMEDGIQKKLGPGTVKNKIGKRTVFNVQRPSDTILQMMIDNQDPEFAAGDEAITPMGYRAAQFLTHAISGFLATHTYAAFRTESVREEGPMEVRLLADTKIFFNDCLVLVFLM